MAGRPALAVFDVNETLFSLQRMGERLSEEGLPDGALDLWFARVLKDGFALTVVGQRAVFRDLAAAHLAGLLRAHGLDGSDPVVDNILSAFAELSPHPDAAPALELLRDAGVRIVTLTNGHRETVERMFQRAGLDGPVERFFSVDEVGLWKPRSEPYRHVVQQCGVAPEQAMMIAVHSWDIDGANRAGLLTGYADRLEGTFVPGFQPPNVSGHDLVEVVERAVGP
jgi:2-haloacid dehalogenase